MSDCAERLRLNGLAYPRTCARCGLGPCTETFVVPAADVVLPLTKFLAWFVGYAENVKEAPTPEQWTRIKEQVRGLEKYVVEHHGRAAGGPFQVAAKGEWEKPQ